MNKTVLAVSCFDASGATGLGADLKCFQTFRVYGAGVATAIAAQNTTGIQGLFPVSMEMVGQQLEAVASDLAIHAVKVGVVVNAPIVQILASLIEAFGLRSLLVVDPVLKASTGESLLDEAGLAALKERLLPLAFAVTPSAADAEALTGLRIHDANSAKEAARAIQAMGPRHVVLTSFAPDSGRAMDLWYDGTSFHLFDAPRLATRNTLGIGTTFAAALTALLVRGAVVGEAVDKAKKYVAKAAQHPFVLGKGRQPLNHTVPM
ncbi:MAG: bifunctional hydroxymethylpyrimidine kinase/phosphomethylpyrimidine kinase [Acidobacteriota bacterium]